MPKLNGLYRFQIVRLWIKRGRQGDKEDFIKKVCEAKGLEYVPPSKVVR